MKRDKDMEALQFALNSERELLEEEHQKLKKALQLIYKLEAMLEESEDVEALEVINQWRLKNYEASL
jgi:hypothetical protein